MGLEQLTPLDFEILPPKQYDPDDRARIQRMLDEAYARGFRPNEIAPTLAMLRAATLPELEQLQQRATETMAESMRCYQHAFDTAAMLLMRHGCRDIARVLTPGGVDELWIDAPTDRARVGDLMPGRCVYRQSMRYDDGKASIVTEWLDPELAEAVAGAGSSTPRP